MIIVAGATFPISLNTLIKMLSRFRHQFTPKASVKTAFEGDHDAITGGLGKCSPGVFGLTLTWEEMALLFEGDVMIGESPARRVRGRLGDFFSAPRFQSR
jgi:uncharacterized cupin superfamily protein